ncbi:hypothetical protein D3C85_1842670 [compost metagenome]
MAAHMRQVGIPLIGVLMVEAAVVEYRVELPTVRCLPVLQGAVDQLQAFAPALAQ